MIVGEGVYDLLGTEAQQAVLLPCFTPGLPGYIAFPWSRLSPPSTPIPIGWMDLNEGLSADIWVREEKGTLGIPGHVHIEDTSGEGHGIVRKIDDRWWIAGVFWTDGRIYVDDRCPPEMAREVVAAELAHSVDYFLPLSDAQKDALLKLLHGDVADGDEHTWWETNDYGIEYYDLGGEAFMGAFTLAYSDIEPDQSAFTHKTTREQGQAVRMILDVPAVGELPPAERPGCLAGLFVSRRSA